jgi:Leucine-rich repeat (LRR) protein
LDRLQYLDFESNAISAAIPKGIGNLSSLAELDLTANLLTGILPPDIGRLVDLQYVSLGSNRLPGQLPSELGLLTNLVELYLYDNSFSGVVPMALSNSLIDLNELRLETNLFTGGLDTLFCNRDDALDVFTADCSAPCDCCTDCYEY